MLSVDKYFKKDFVCLLLGFFCWPFLLCDASFNNQTELDLTQEIKPDFFN